ncbi:uncharacterized protein FFB20_11550 [Fusarium fujikuroi]|nr:uncharacterized protein FFE2_03477 [Fusarium fujikuroi]SCN78229.1 uncharacterized protein FFM5_01815 [Fusarium fujikuroi]SCN94620.1 uncharacterized protein FFC1_07056 [Fusarium fujikuroi]SCO02186.1 uncharacterized protein FFB20_11550 [Fusarium fujikuroi]SCO33902.1 uncharacterized protein FFMR_03274 [Fusarium fujikuroi]
MRQLGLVSMCLRYEKPEYRISVYADGL